MTVMSIRKVGVTMPELRVHVPVRVGLPRWFAAIMAVLMVLIMHMSMLVRHLFVAMFVLVALRQMKPHSDGHERPGGHELDRHRIPQNEYGDQPAEEWSQRKVRTGPGRSDVSKSNDKQHETDTVAGKSHNHRGTEHPRWWKCRAKPEGDAHVYHSRHTPLQKSYLDRIRLRDLAGQVVVDGPCETRASDQDGAQDGTEGHMSAPR